MRILLTGLRGVGKSSVRKRIAEDLQLPSRSVGDFMEEHCCKLWPGISREEMQERLNIEQQLVIFHDLLREVGRFPRLLLEAQTVICGPFGTLIPVQPLFRDVGLEGIILLESSGDEIARRRRNDPDKRRVERFLQESPREIERQQYLTEQYLIALGVGLGISVFIIQNTTLEEAVSSAHAAIHLIQHESDFKNKIRSRNI